MTLDQLQYVLEVAKTGSMNKAAKNLFISQSVISTSIGRLEKEIGHAVFTRSNHGVALTVFGHTFVSYVSSIQTQISQLDHLITYGSVQNVERVSIASTGYFFLDRICADIHEKYSETGIHIELLEDDANSIADLVAQQSVEFGIINQWSCFKAAYVKQVRSKGLQYHPIAVMDVSVSVGNKNPLYASGSDSVSPEELTPFPAVMYTYNDAGPYSDIFKKLGLANQKNRIITSSRATIYEMLKNTSAYYLNSSYRFDLLNSDESSIYRSMRTLPLKNCPIRSEVAWLGRRDAALSPIAQEVLDSFLSFF